jgi:hypothetical protein
MFERKRGKDPTAMRVEFAIVDDKQRHYAGILLMRAEESINEFAREDGEGKVTISHQFLLPASNVSLAFDEPSSGDADRVVEAAMAMGVHQSTEWESVALGRYAFLFRCTPLFWPAGA